MIKTKEDLNKYIKEDCLANIRKESISSLSLWFKLLYGSDSGKAFNYLKALRKYEYSLNNNDGSLCNKIVLAYRRLIWHRLSNKYNLMINPNMVGYGLYIPHTIGGGIVVNCQKMGNYCKINVNVLLGNKSSNEERATIGDNVSFCPGCVVIGKIRIGNNVIIAPNSVVIKDVPDNCVVSGVPAKIIKQNGIIVK